MTPPQESNAAAAAAAAEAEAPATREVAVLIVEDSLTQAMKLQHILERHRHRVTTARNGEEALAALAPGRALPRIVISDINMPRMDGYELCSRIKDDARLKSLPVILLTSLSDPKDILKGLECGADNFIVKPYDEEFLLSRIEYVLANQELRENGRNGTEIFFAGHKYRLTSERIHSIDLLLSTYETAVQKNLELSKAKEMLEAQAEELREKNAQMEADLDMARELQTAFLPSVYPRFSGGGPAAESALTFCHRYSTTTELGGDFFDVLEISKSQAGVFICDVMGHGVRAALVTAIVRGLVEELTPLAGDPGRFLTEMNDSLCAILKQTLTPLFASAFYGVVDVAAGVVRYANAGHPSPFLLRRGAGKVERIEPPGARPGRALGVFEKLAFQSAEQPLAAGDAILLFTDGLYEVQGADESFYDIEMLTSAISRRAALPTPVLFDELLAEIKEYSSAKKFEDDVCLVGIDIARIGSASA